MILFPNPNDGALVPPLALRTPLVAVRIEPVSALTLSWCQVWRRGLWQEGGSSALTFIMARLQFPSDNTEEHTEGSSLSPLTKPPTNHLSQHRTYKDRLQIFKKHQQFLQASHKRPKASQGATRALKSRMESIHVVVQWGANDVACKGRKNHLSLRCKKCVDL